MKFNNEHYMKEMQELIHEARDKWLVEHPNIIVFTINIWTDPDAAVSAVNFDTEENSVVKVDVINKFSKPYYDKHIKEDNEEMAKLFLPVPPEGRNCNPADFAFRAFVEKEHEAFAPFWEEKSDGKCWDVLEPALIQVGEKARVVFANLKLHPKAELSVNSRRDWYDKSWPIV